MVAMEYIYNRQYEAITALRDVIERLDPERGAELRSLSYGGAVPNSAKQPDLYATYLTEAILVLAKRVDELEGRARRGGRPQNVVTS